MAANQKKEGWTSLTILHQANLIHNPSITIYSFTTGTYFLPFNPTHTKIPHVLRDSTKTLMA